MFFFFVCLSLRFLFSSTSWIILRVIYSESTGDFLLIHTRTQYTTRTVLLAKSRYNFCSMKFHTLFFPQMDKYVFQLPSGNRKKLHTLARS